MSIKNGKKMSPQKAFFGNGCVKRNLARFSFQKPFTHCQVILSYQLWNCTMPTLATTSPLASTHSPYGHMHNKFMRSTHLFIGETMGHAFHVSFFQCWYLDGTSMVDKNEPDVVELCQNRRTICNGEQELRK
jgi:hypothetical protein